MTEKNMFTAMDKKTITEVVDNLKRELEYRFPYHDIKVYLLGREIYIYVGTKIMECDSTITDCNEYTINMTGSIETDLYKMELYPKRYEHDYDIVGLGVIVTFKNDKIDSYLANDLAQLIRSVVYAYR